MGFRIFFLLASFGGLFFFFGLLLVALEDWGYTPGIPEGLARSGDQSIVWGGELVRHATIDSAEP